MKDRMGCSAESARVLWTNSNVRVTGKWCFSHRLEKCGWQNNVECRSLHIEQLTSDSLGREAWVPFEAEGAALNVICMLALQAFPDQARLGPMIWDEMVKLGVPERWEADDASTVVVRFRDAFEKAIDALCPTACFVGRKNSSYCGVGFVDSHDTWRDLASWALRRSGAVREPATP